MKTEKWSRAKKDHRVAQIDIYTNNIIKVYDSLIEAAKISGVSKSGISLCINGINKSAGHYKWSRVEDLENER